MLQSSAIRLARGTLIALRDVPHLVEWTSFWARDAKAKITRPVQVRVMTSDTPGILATVSQMFTAHRINIHEATCRANEDGRACNIFTFQVSDVAQLRTIMTDLAELQGVVQVERV